jgi:threonine/homoserine/homoserine lactone efflux protein
LLFNILKWLGAAYLLYVGIKSLQAKRSTAQLNQSQHRQVLNRLVAVRMGFFTNLLNPKVTLFFFALFTQVIRPTTPLPIQAIYGLTMVCLEFTWFALVAVLISQQSIKNRLLSISHWIERATGVVLIALGLRLAIASADE